MNMISAGLACALIYWVINVTDSLIGWQTLSRPIVVAPITGLILGDFRTGIVMGASLEALYMGISAIGGVVPADALTSSIIAVAFSIVTHSDMETGLALAMPIGTIMSNLRIVTFTVSNMLHEFFYGMTKRGEVRKYEIALFWFSLLHQSGAERADHLLCDRLRRGAAGSQFCWHQRRPSFSADSGRRRSLLPRWASLAFQFRSGLRKPASMSAGLHFSQVSGAEHSGHRRDGPASCA